MTDWLRDKEVGLSIFGHRLCKTQNGKDAFIFKTRATQAYLIFRTGLGHIQCTLLLDSPAHSSPVVQSPGCCCLAIPDRKEALGNLKRFLHRDPPLSCALNVEILGAQHLPPIAL